VTVPCYHRDTIASKHPASGAGQALSGLVFRPVKPDDCHRLMAIPDSTQAQRPASQSK